MVQITIKSRGKKLAGLPGSIDVSSSTTIKEVVSILAKSTNLSENRIRVSLPPTEDKPVNGKKKSSGHAPNPEETVKNIFAGSEASEISTLYVKDLGLQTGWRTVYVIEYFGPLVIHPLFYLFQKQVYGEEFEHSTDQKILFAFAMIHFLKREYETVFVHKFSLDTMPFIYAIRNSAHYWILSGLLLAYFNYAPPSYSSPDASLFMKLLFGRQWIETDSTAIWGLSLLWVYAQVSNLWTHLALASLRMGNEKRRQIPRGYGFDLVSFPNYFFESLGWFSVTMINQNWSAVVFLIVGTATMLNWAIQKHRRYRQDFADYPRNRKVMFPFVH
jgi:very-long-chain enoyl-CoA reductase